MALRITLTKRLIDGYRSGRPLPASPERFSSTVVLPSAHETKILREYMTSPNYRRSGGLLRRFLHRPASVKLPEFLSLPVGDRLRETLTGISSGGDRIRMRIDALAPPQLRPHRPQDHVPAAGNALNSLSVTETKKLLRTYQLEKLKAKLREIPGSCVSHSEFVQICAEGCANDDQVSDLVKFLDDSGNVIILGGVVFLRPEQMAKSLEALISQASALQDDPRRRELAKLERRKAMIDQKARSRVRAELYCGLGLLAAQTLGFMRLTFWELSWDVMEPICFFVGSLHLFLGYAFFLRTSTEPSFEGFFLRRFRVKQKRLMETHGFDLERYNELKMTFYPPFCRCYSCPHESTTVA